MTTKRVFYERSTELLLLILREEMKKDPYANEGDERAQNRD